MFLSNQVFLSLPMDLSFPKKEKLKSRKLIEQLFAEGESLKKFPVKIIYMEIPTLEHTQAAFAVPKRSFKSAVKRNKIKRQMREAYRLHKNSLTMGSGKKFAVLFIYIGREGLAYKTIEGSVIHSLKKMNS